MALNYKDTTKLVTTDDVVMTGDAAELGENLSDVLLKQSEDIAQLKGNVKWIAKYGGVGGGSGSGGGGGGETSTSLKYEVNVRYTDINGMGAIVKANLKQSSIAPILCKGNTKVSVEVIITSMMSSAGMYTATLSYGGSSDMVLPIPTVRGYVTLSFNADSSRPSYECTLLVRGETVHTLTFQVFTLILLNDIHLSSEGRRFIDNSSISSSDIADLTLNMDIENQMINQFDIEILNVSINGIPLEAGIKEKIKVGYIFRVYGLYNLVVNFKAINKITGEEYEYITNQIFVYKESDKVFVYCFTNSDEFLVYNTPVAETPIGTNLRNVPLMFRVYGTAYDPPGTSYIININGDPYKKPCKVHLDYQYSLANTLTEDSLDYVEVPISFSVGNDTSTYYVYLKKAGELAYIFTKDSNQKCYGAKGDNTDAVLKNGTVNLPNKPLGESYWLFSNNTNNKITINKTCIPNGYLYNRGDTVTVANFISSEITTSDTKMYDAIVNIGVKYNDTSYENPIFTFGDNIDSPTKIEFYRNKIVNGNSSTDRFGMPDDNKFHLITVYFKLNYRTTNTSISWGESISFAVYIDGVLDVKPTATNYTFGIKSVVTMHPGANLYNFFGVEVFNPTPMSIGGAQGYSDVVRKYVLDYDPFIVSNYFMCYATLHYSDLGYSEPPFSDTLLNSMSRDIYANLIDNSTYNYVNYYSLPSEDGRRTAYNKFIPVNIQLFSNLLDRDNSIPLYRIVPDYTDTSSTEAGLHIFVKKTMDSFTEETQDSAVINGYTCRFQRFDFNLNQWVDILKDVVLDEEGHMHNVKFIAKFQGSSTLLYSVKNFSIETQPFEDRENNITYQFYFNPDSTKFDYPETSFNLKADLVDSSSCTNNVMGNFINAYMESPFDRDNHTYKSCLSGRPILLFMSNNTSQEGDATSNDLFLGIYNLNLNRSSVNNLGYLRMPELEHQEANFSDTYCVVTNLNTAITVPNGMAVAEMQGNGNLYDFSLFDYGLLHKIFGDFYTVTGGRVVKEYSSAIQLLCRDFAYYVHSKILKKDGDVVFNANDYSLSSKPNARDELASQIGLDNIGYYALVGSGNQSTLQFRTLNTLPDPNNIIIIDYNVLAGDSSSYRSLDENGFAIVGNAAYQFHLLYSGGASPAPLVLKSTNYYYVENINPTYTDNNEQTFDLVTSLKYYMVCMAFAMVDSVQKNMNIKRPDNNKIWYPLFYDMDTALALDNSGNNSNYKAFSDYVDEHGNIISDYAGDDAKAWFDTPSSYLFMFAKYDALLNHQSAEDETGLKHHTPLEYWMSLRGVAEYLDLPCAGALSSAQLFCDNYLNTYLVEDIPPIIWNLNYMYKYFSETKNQSLTGNTEESRFNGRMIYRRRTWLSQRLHYLDALFGISNARTIGKTSIPISEGPKPPGNLDIEVCGTMFPDFTKGISEARINTRVKDLPRTPLILQSAASTFKLYITDDLGYADIEGNITSNTEIAFNGTTHLLEVGDCGQFLLNTSNPNYIQGDLIKDIVISSRKCESITLDMTMLPSVRTITIGNKGDKVVVNRDIIITGDTLAETELTIIIKNVACQRLILSNCTLAADSVIEKISSPGNSSTAGAILNMASCIFLGNLNIKDSSFQSIELSTNTHYGNFTINSNATSTISVNSVYFKNPSHSFIIDAPLLISLTVAASEIYKLYHKLSLNLNECNIGLRKTTPGGTAQIILNYDYVLNKLSPWIINATNSNNILQSITISQLAFDNVVISIPLFKVLQELNLTGVFRLGKMGLTGTGLSSILIMSASSLNGIIGFDSNIDSAFALFEGDILSENNTELTLLQWNSLMGNVNSAVLCFGKRNKGIDFNVIKKILQAIKSNLNGCNIQGLFASTNITVNGSTNGWTNSYALITELAEAYPINDTLAVNRGSYVFHNTNLRRLTSQLASNLGGVYKDFMGTSANNNYIESGALVQFTTITDGINTAGWSNDGGPDITSFWPKVYFFDVQGGEMIEHNNIKYSEEFAQALTLYLQVVTTQTISFDFENGMGSNIRVYRGLFNRFSSGANYGNIKNIGKMFNDTRMLTSSNVSADFHGLEFESQLYDTSGLTVSLYPFLVTQGGLLDEKAYRVLSSGTTTSEIYPLEGSFAKTISAEDFISLIDKLILANKSNIACIFHNCSITGITAGEELDFFERAFKNKLLYFSNLCCAFRKAKFFNTAGKLVAMVLSNMFTIVTEEDGVVLEYLGTKTSNLRRAFEYCYIQPFTGKLGIADGRVSMGYRAFAGCTYNYPIFSSYADLYNSSVLSVFNIPKLEDASSILPQGFLSFCSNTEDALLEMFAYTSYSSDHLTGFIPEIDNYFGNSSTFKDTFKRCNIYYHPYYTNITKETIDPNRWIIFPGWYTGRTSSFDVYIPLPLLTPNATDSDPIMCSIFGYYEDIFGSSYDYGVLPRFADLLSNYTTYPAQRLADNTHALCRVYLSLDPQHDLPPRGGSVKNIIPVMLSPLVSIGRDSTIIRDITSRYNLNNYYPVNAISSNSGLSARTIYKGVLQLGGDCALITVTSIS